MSGAADLDLSWITADLAVGGRIQPGGAAVLAAEHAVGYVIDMREEACDDEAELAACGLRFLRLPTRDHHAPTQAQLDTGAAFADQAGREGGKLLIPCEHGIGRSATLALCVLAARGFEPLAALRRAKDRRALVSPSPAQYEAWAAWLRRRVSEAAIPGFDDFKAIAYRHLQAQA